MNGKICHLPRHIREQLNRRLDDGEGSSTLLPWLNSLPEVQTILAARFGGKKINRSNLSRWKKSGFRKWQLRQTALQFVAEMLPEDAADNSLTDALSEKLAQWAGIKYAAAAAADAMAGIEGDPENEMRRLREFCTDINNLRRGDLSAGRLALERERLALLRTKSEKEKEIEFWQWTKRPDVQEKLYPHRDPEKIRRDVDRMISSRLMGIRYPDEPDPAILI